MRETRLHALSLVWLCLCAAPLAIARGQDISHIPISQMTPFAIAVVDSLAYPDADAVVVRRPSAQPHDVILVRRGKADPSRLADAVRLLEILRASGGDLPTSQAAFRVTSSGHRDSRLEEAVAWADWLEHVRKRTLDGYGEAAVIQLYLPNHR